jgi:hypothetical protein
VVQAGSASGPFFRPARRALQPAVASEGTRGGKLALAAAIGLGLIALTVELDRRKMRSAQLAAEAGG